MLLVDWASPERLEDMLEAAEIDWRPNATERALLDDKENHPKVYRFGWANLTGAPPPDTTYLRVTAGGVSGAGCWNCQDFTADFVTLYGFLFQGPTAAFRTEIHTVQAQLFGAPATPYNSMHVRMGDGAEGSKLRSKSNFYTNIKDTRSTLLQAAVAVACVIGAEVRRRRAARLPHHRPLPLLSLPPSCPRSRHCHSLSQPTTRLSRRLSQPVARCVSPPPTRGGCPELRPSPRRCEQGMVNATKLVGPNGFRQVVVSGCTDCMVNAVHKHAKDFSGEGVHGIFLDLALLSGGKDFVRMGKGSNYATWAEGWRGKRRGRNLDFPSSFPEKGTHTCASWQSRLTKLRSNHSRVPTAVPPPSVV